MLLLSFCQTIRQIRDKAAVKSFGLAIMLLYLYLPGSLMAQADPAKTGVPDLQIAGDIAFASWYKYGHPEIFAMTADGTDPRQLTHTPEVNWNTSEHWNPSWSPDGTKVIFASVGNIYVMDVERNTLMRLPAHSGMAHAPAWSPDGTKIAFFSRRDGNCDIYLMNADGTNQQRLTKAAEVLEPLNLSWSPDGTRIAFAVDKHRQNVITEIFVVNADGTGLGQLAQDLSGGSIAWSPDGTKIAFGSNHNDITAEIYVMDVDGTDLTQLTTNTYPDRNPSWSPDGTAIAFVSRREGNGDIYRMNADGTDQRRLTSTPAYEDEPSWAPFRHIGATRIGVPVSRAMTIENKGNAILRVSDITCADGQFTASPTSFSVFPGSSQQVAVTFVPTSPGTKYTPLTITSNDLDAETIKLMVNGTGIAPDAQITSQIAFSSKRDGNWEIYRMNADGTEQRRLTNSRASDWDPAWSPDGTRIAFASKRDGNDEIYLMNADGTEQRRLTFNSARDGDPSWSPEGTRIVFSSSRDDNDEIYLMKADGTDLQRLTDNVAYDVDPSWSPDEKRMAFASTRDGNWEIYQMNTDGTNPVRMTNNISRDESPSWSPNGSAIAFHSNRDGNDEIYVMNADSVEIAARSGMMRADSAPRTSPQRLTDNVALDQAPSWSLDGTAIAFHSNRAGNDDIYVMNADGSDQRRITTHLAQDQYPSMGGTDRSITVGTAKGSPGDLVVVPILTNNAAGLASGTLTLNYDARVLIAEQVNESPLLNSAGITVTTKLETPGQVRVSAQGPTGISSGGGTLATVVFEIKSAAAVGAYPLTLEANLKDERGAGIPYIPVPSSMTVFIKPMGDVSGDNMVDSLDVRLILQHSSGLIALTASQREIGDVNKDGIVDPGDAILVLRRVNGLIVDFPNKTPSKLRVSDF